MRDAMIKKEDLIKRIKKNREDHVAIFNEAVEGYRTEVTKILEDHIKRIKKGKLMRVYVSLPEPVNHTDDYDRILDMLAMDLEDTVLVSEIDFARYVRDDWDWKRQFIDTNSAYSVSAAKLAGNN